MKAILTNNQITELNEIEQRLSKIDCSLGDNPDLSLLETPEKLSDLHVINVSNPFITTDLEIAYHFESDGYKGTCVDGKFHGEVKGKTATLFFDKDKYLATPFRLIPFSLKKYLEIPNKAEDQAVTIKKYFHLIYSIR